MRSSLNASSEIVTRLKFLLNTSMRFWLKFAASKKWLPSISTHVSPRNTAPFFDSSTSVIAVDCPFVTGVAGGPQPAIVPFFVAKINDAGLFAAKSKSLLPLNIIPVGPDGPFAPAALGTVTTSGVMAPAPLYKVEVPVPSLFTHQGLAAPRARPQAFFRLGSTVTVVPSALAGCVVSDTKFSCV